MPSDNGSTIPCISHLILFPTEDSRDLKDNTKEKDRLEYYLWLAKIAEKGKISCIFFADSKYYSPKMNSVF